MEFIKPNTKFDFVGKRKIAYGASITLILLSIASIVFHGGLKYGIDFAGGTIIQVKFPGAVATENVKSGLAKIGLMNTVVQTFGNSKNNEYLVRTDKPVQTSDNLSQQIKDSIKAATGVEPEIRRVEMVGPQVGKDLQEKALFAIYYSMLFIAIYISGRFDFRWMACVVIAAALMGSVYLLSQFNISMAILTAVALVITLVLFWVLNLKYAMGAIVALIHDVTITVGCFSMFGKEFSLPIVAAILSIMGYSLNDTIIVYDRIRENIRKYPKNTLGVTINRSVNETLSRTILTSGLTLLAVVSLLIFGGGIIHDFALAMLVGIIVGTYSSIYVASPVLMAWHDAGKKK